MSYQYLVTIVIQQWMNLLSPLLRLLLCLRVRRRLPYTFAVARQIDGIKKRESAADSPDQPHAESDESVRTEFAHLASLFQLGSHRDREGILAPGHSVVERVALHGHASRFGNQAAEFLARHALRCGSARIMVYLFFNYRAIQVVCSKAERNLRNLRSEHLPISLDVRKVVEQQAAHRDLPHIGEARRHGQVIQRGVFGMKSQRDKRLKSAGFILQGAQLQQMIDTILVVLNVAVEHGRV